MARFDGTNGATTFEDDVTLPKILDLVEEQQQTDLRL